MAAAGQPDIEAYTITFRPQDQRLEAMPDDALYARKMAAHLGIRLHEIEISPDVVDLLPRMVDTLDEPIGDPAAINTVLMCEAARSAGALGARMTGGGFGGSSIALLPADAVAGAERAIATAFAERGWHAPASFAVTAGTSAHRDT